MFGTIAQLGKDYGEIIIIFLLFPIYHVKYHLEYTLSISV